MEHKLDEQCQSYEDTLRIKRNHDIANFIFPQSDMEHEKAPVFTFNDLVKDLSPKFKDVFGRIDSNTVFTYSDIPRQQFILDTFNNYLDYEDDIQDLIPPLSLIINYDLNTLSSVD